MPILRFELEGLVNSFRIPETATYQHTELTPKKTHIAGMIANIMGKTEGFYYNTLLRSIRIGVIPLRLENLFVDLWQYKKWKKSNIGGLAVVKREKLFKPSYLIYCETEDNDLFRDIKDSLKRPKRIPSIGLDDELVIIHSVKKVKDNYTVTRKERIHTTFPYILADKYEFNPTFSRKLKPMIIFPPRTTITPIHFDMGPPRRVVKSIEIVEFFADGYFDITFSSKQEILLDGERGIVLW